MFVVACTPLWRSEEGAGTWELQTIRRPVALCSVAAFDYVIYVGVLMARPEAPTFVF